jgi:hypothetical protein
MTPGQDDADFAETDAYIVRQLHEAIARLHACADTNARLQEALRTARHERTHNEKASVSSDG